MPARSKAQLRLLFAKEARGEVKPGTAREWARATPNISKLPERVGDRRKKRVRKADVTLVIGMKKSLTAETDINKGGPPLGVSTSFHGKHSMYAATHLLAAHKAKGKKQTGKVRMHLKAARAHDAAADGFATALAHHSKMGHAKHPKTGKLYRQAFKARKTAFHASEKAGGLLSWGDAMKHMAKLKKSVAGGYLIDLMKAALDVGASPVETLMKATSQAPDLTKSGGKAPKGALKFRFVQSHNMPHRVSAARTSHGTYYAHHTSGGLAFHYTPRGEARSWSKVGTQYIGDSMQALRRHHAKRVKTKKSLVLDLAKCSTKKHKRKHTDEKTTVA